MISSDGVVTGTLNNQAGGEVRVVTGEQLRLAVAGNTNAGQFNLFGGTMEFAQDLTNLARGFISGNGTFIATSGLNNAGTMNFSGGANVSGDVTNGATGLVISAGGTTTFFDDVVNGGEIRTSQNNFTVYFGSYSGNGHTGVDGTVIMKGDLRSGSSPAMMTFAGNEVFGAAATTLIEMGGTVRGDEYDAVDVNSSRTLDGTLDVTLLAGFLPNPGDPFAIITANTISGTFNTYNAPALPATRCCTCSTRQRS